MTVERHSIYFVPPRSVSSPTPRKTRHLPASISEDSTVSCSSASSIASESTVDDEGHGASPDAECPAEEAECSYRPRTPPQPTLTSFRLRIPPNSSAAGSSNASSSSKQQYPTGSNRKSHFVSWKVTAPSIKQLGSSTYQLSTEFPAPKLPMQPLLAQATLAASAAANVPYSGAHSWTAALANVSPPHSRNPGMFRRTSSSSCQTNTNTSSKYSSPTSTMGSSSVRSTSPSRARSISGPQEREHESVLFALAAKPRLAEVGKQVTPGAGQRAQPVPLLSDSPSLRDSPADEGKYVVTKANSVLVQATDLNWYLDKVLWKLGVHRKARKDYLAYWLPRFTQEAYVAVRFLPFADFHSAIPFDLSPADPDIKDTDGDSTVPSPSSLSSTLSLHRVFALFRRVRADEAGNWSYIVRGGSSTQGVIDWTETCAMPVGWAKDDSVPLLLEVGGLDTGSRSYFFD